MTQPKRSTKIARIAGWLIGGLPALLLVVMSFTSVFETEMSVQGLRDAGYPDGVGRPLGLIVVASGILYLLPRVGGIGAILLTGYLGGAVATHVRMGDPWFMVAPAIVFATLLWTGLILRDKRLRAILPL